MALDAVSSWKSAFAAMPNVSDDSWKANLANTIHGLVNGKLSSPGLLSGGQPAAVFTFGKAAFQSALSGGTAANISSAIQSGLNASSVLVAPGSFIGSATPATTFSVVASAVLDPTSIAAAVAKVMTIANQPAVSVATDSAVPGIFRDAFLLLKLTTTGTDSTPPPSGPLPLTDSLRSMG